MFNGKIHYKWSFSIAMLNYQRGGLGRTKLKFKALVAGVPLGLTATDVPIRTRRLTIPGKGIELLMGYP